MSKLPSGVSIVTESALPLIFKDGPRGQFLCLTKDQDGNAKICAVDNNTGAALHGRDSRQPGNAGRGFRRPRRHVPLGQDQQARRLLYAEPRHRAQERPCRRVPPGKPIPATQKAPRQIDCRRQQNRPENRAAFFILPVKQSQPEPDRHHPTPYGTSSRRPAGSRQRPGLPASGRP